MNEVLQFTVTIIAITGSLISFIIGVVLHKKLAVQIASIFLIIIGVSVIMGYILNIPKIYTIPADQVGMALPTGICFLVTGTCILILANEIEFKK